MHFYRKFIVSTISCRGSKSVNFYDDKYDHSKDSSKNNNFIEKLDIFEHFGHKSFWKLIDFSDIIELRHGLII